MSELMNLVQVNGQAVAVVCAGAILLILSTLVILQIRLLQRVKRVQNKVDAVTERVENYLSVILESEAETEEMEQRAIALQEKIQREEEENRIISTVLQEIFP